MSTSTKSNINLLKNINPLDISDKDVDILISKYINTARIPLVDGSNTKIPYNKLLSMYKSTIVMMEIIKLKAADLDVTATNLQIVVDDLWAPKLNSLISNIIDYSTAYEAYSTYNASWFAACPVSITKKRNFAQNLIDSTSYYKTVLDVWTALVNNDAEVSDLCQYTPTEE